MLKYEDLSGCFNRHQFQTKKISDYEKIVLPIINKSENKDIAQFVIESIIIRRASNFEELLKCLIMIASIREETKTIEYFKINGNEETKANIQRGCDLGTLSAYAQAELSFKDDAKKLERIFQHLFGFSPFPNQEAKDYVLDMNLIRNIVVHEGGWPNERHARQIRHPTAIKVSAEIELKKGVKTVFYKLELTDYRFVINLIAALAEILIHIAEKISEINK
jgi:hypothetical protein